MISTVEPILEPGIAVYRTARKPWRCIAADPIRYWRIRTRKSSDPPDWDWSGWSGSYRTEADAVAAAEVKIGSPSNYDTTGSPHLRRKPIAWYTAAEAEPVPNPNYRDRSPDCQGDIQPGDRYVEYLGEATAYESGSRYCLPCGIAAWRV